MGALNYKSKSFISRPWEYIKKSLRLNDTNLSIYNKEEIILKVETNEETWKNNELLPVKKGLVKTKITSKGNILLATTLNASREFFDKKKKFLIEQDLKLQSLKRKFIRKISNYFYFQFLFVSSRINVLSHGNKGLMLIHPEDNNSANVHIAAKSILHEKSSQIDENGVLIETPNVFNKSLTSGKNILIYSSFKYINKIKTPKMGSIKTHNYEFLETIPIPSKKKKIEIKIIIDYMTDFYIFQRDIIMVLKELYITHSHIDSFNLTFLRMNFHFHTEILSKRADKRYISHFINYINEVSKDGTTISDSTNRRNVSFKANFKTLFMDKTNFKKLFKLLKEKPIYYVCLSDYSEEILKNRLKNYDKFAELTINGNFTIRVTSDVKIEKNDENIR